MKKENASGVGSSRSRLTTRGPLLRLVASITRRQERKKGDMKTLVARGGSAERKHRDG